MRQGYRLCSAFFTRSRRARRKPLFTMGGVHFAGAQARAFRSPQAPLLTGHVDRYAPAKLRRLPVRKLRWHLT